MSESNGTCVLRIEHLRKSYGDTPVLHDINLEVDQGEVIVLIGASGCGKSTLLRCVNALESYEGGTIYLDGEPIGKDEKKIQEARQRIGMVFQSYDLFPHKNVLDNVTLAPTIVQKRPKKEVEAEARALLARVGLEDKADSFPRQLSGGQKQRVAIARALAMKPEILLLDEITAALDPEMVHEVLDVILDLAADGKTMLIVTHEMGFARAVADRIVLIADGIILEEGTPEEMFENPKTEQAKSFLRSMEFTRRERKEPGVSEEIQEDGAAEG